MGLNLDEWRAKFAMAALPQIMAEWTVCRAERGDDFDETEAKCMADDCFMVADAMVEKLRAGK
jgi:hypothetical protein